MNSYTSKARIAANKVNRFVVATVFIAVWVMVEKAPGQNTFYGAFAGYVSHGSANSAFGYDAMRFNDTGSYNTAVGFQSLDQNTTSGLNTATGAFALFNNTQSG